MKALFIPLILLSLTGCGRNLIDQSTDSINANSWAIQRSSEVIRQNSALIEESNAVIAENQRLLEKMQD